MRLASGAGSRAAKYRHLLAEALPMDAAEQAVMCVLMLRGPQTPGELKQRGERMHAFAISTRCSATLAALIERGLVARLERRPGQKEERYASCSKTTRESRSPRIAPAAGAGARARAHRRHANGAGPLEQRVERLERELAELRAAVEASRLGEGGAP